MDTWGQVGYLTDTQKKCLSEFLDKVDKIHLTQAKFTVETEDQVACRFLRARQFDVDKAATLLQDCCSTLNEKEASKFEHMDPDEILDCEMTVLRKFYPHNQIGYDKYNRPLLFDNSGMINMNGITHLTTEDSLVGYHFWTMEKVLDDLFTEGAERAKTLDKKVENCVSTCVILDLQGCSLSTVANSAAINHIKMLISLDNVCYPEMLGKMFVVNSPSFIVSTFEMVKGWLDIRTQKKIELLGSGPDMTARLLEYIDADQLPARYGGTASPDIYLAPSTCHPNCEYVPIPYNSQYVISNVEVPSNKTLVVETYIKDGGFELMVLEQKGKVAQESGKSSTLVGNVVKRSKSLFGPAASVPPAGSAAAIALLASAPPRGTITADGDKILRRTAFRPRNAGVEERVTVAVPPSPPSTSSSSGDPTTVFQNLSVSDNKEDATPEVTTRYYRIIWANPSQTMMAQNKIIVHSYRID